MRYPFRADVGGIYFCVASIAKVTSSTNTLTEINATSNTYSIVATVKTDWLADYIKTGIANVNHTAYTFTLSKAGSNDALCTVRSDFNSSGGITTAACLDIHYTNRNFAVTDNLHTTNWAAYDYATLVVSGNLINNKGVTLTLCLFNDNDIDNPVVFSKLDSGLVFIGYN